MTQVVQVPVIPRSLAGVVLPLQREILVKLIADPSLTATMVLRTLVTIPRVQIVCSVVLRIRQIVHLQAVFPLPPQRQPQPLLPRRPLAEEGAYVIRNVQTRDTRVARVIPVVRRDTPLGAGTIAPSIAAAPPRPQPQRAVAEAEEAGRTRKQGMCLLIPMTTGYGMPTSLLINWALLLPYLVEALLLQILADTTRLCMALAPLPPMALVNIRLVLRFLPDILLLTGHLHLGFVLQEPPNVPRIQETLVWGKGKSQEMCMLIPTKTEQKTRGGRKYAA